MSASGGTATCAVCLSTIRLLRTMSLLVAVMAGSWAVWYALIPAYAIGTLGLSPRAYGFLLIGVFGIMCLVLVRLFDIF